MSPPHSNQVEPAVVTRQKQEVLQFHETHEGKNDSARMVNSVIEKAESENTCAESIESIEACFDEQEHGNLSKIAMLYFSGCKGAYVLSYEFRAKEIDDHQELENIAKQCSVDKDRPSEEA